LLFRWLSLTRRDADTHQPEVGLDFEQIEAFEGWDAVGRKFKCNIAPWRKRTWSRIKTRRAKEPNTAESV